MMAASLATAAAQVVVVAMLGHLNDSTLYVRAAFTPVLFAFLALGEALSATTQVSAALAAAGGSGKAPGGPARSWASGCSASRQQPA